MWWFNGDWARRFVESGLARCHAAYTRRFHTLFSPQFVSRTCARVCQERKDHAIVFQCMSFHLFSHPPSLSLYMDVDIDIHVCIHMCVCVLCTHLFVGILKVERIWTGGCLETELGEKKIDCKRLFVTKSHKAVHELEHEGVFLKHPKVLEFARPRIGSARAEWGLRIGAEGPTVLVKDYVAKIYVLELWLIWKVCFGFMRTWITFWALFMCDFYKINGTRAGFLEY